MKNLKYQLFVVMAVGVAVFATYDDEQLERDDIIEAVNRAQTLWKAGRNFHPSYTKSMVKTLLGLKESTKESRLPELVENDDEDFGIPESFDARQKWSKCAALQTIRNQGNCASCWAVSTASAFTDRLCIASNASFNGQLSAEEVLCCCRECGKDGCKGGKTAEAWEYFLNHGIVTGGDYNSDQGCQPYTIKPANIKLKYSKYVPTPECEKVCYNKLYKQPFQKDHHRVKGAFGITDIKAMQKEIYRNGPIVAQFFVYMDFVHYKKGVYYHVNGSYVGYHAVKVIGWGVEAETPYWLAANSWGSGFGELDGFFKIKRGNNECGFEDAVSAGHL